MNQDEETSELQEAYDIVQDHLVKAEQRLREKDADIERLKRDLVDAVQNIQAHSMIVDASEKDAEIERLKVAYQESQATVLKYWEQRTSNHKLITDLANALEDYAFSPEDEHPGRWDMNLLIQRAREATKCQP